MQKRLVVVVVTFACIASQHRQTELNIAYNNNMNNNGINKVTFRPRCLEVVFRCASVLMFVAGEVNLVLYQTNKQIVYIRPTARHRPILNYVTHLKNIFK